MKPMHFSTQGAAFIVCHATGVISWTPQLSQVNCKNCLRGMYADKRLDSQINSLRLWIAEVSSTANDKLDAKTKAAALAEFRLLLEAKLTEKRARVVEELEGLERDLAEVRSVIRAETAQPSQA